MKLTTGSVVVYFVTCVIAEKCEKKSTDGEQSLNFNTDGSKENRYQPKIDNGDGCKLNNIQMNLICQRLRKYSDTESMRLKRKVQLRMTSIWRNKSVTIVSPRDLFDDRMGDRLEPFFYVHGMSSYVSNHPAMAYGIRKTNGKLILVYSELFPNKHIQLLTKKWAKLANEIAKSLSEFILSALCNVEHDSCKMYENAWNLNFIGFGYGTYVAAYIARQYKNLTGLSAQRLIALDPTDTKYREYQIRPDDGEEVLTFFTNTRKYAIPRPVGGIDLYINGGAKQWGDCNDLCSHKRAFEYFLDSFQHPILAVKCPSYNQVLCGMCLGGSLVEVGGSYPRYKIAPGSYHAFAACKKPYALLCNLLRCPWNCERCGDTHCDKCDGFWVHKNSSSLEPRADRPKP